ncbi:MAG: FumA C-terminus/TtdB family hydratase beta subunit [Candidatus Hydrothermarchaeaceae archaeon]
MLLEVPVKGEITLKVRDIVYLTGEIITARDRAHRMLVEEGATLPVDFNTIYHCGPLVKKTNGFEVISAGPTTSSRMERYTKAMVGRFGTRIFIGKGGMGEESQRIFKENGCVYLAFTGGAGALAARCIKEVKGVHWEDLGMPEAVWRFRVENFGPLVVAMDSRGGSLYKR